MPSWKEPERRKTSCQAPSLTLTLTLILTRTPTLTLSNPRAPPSPSVLLVTGTRVASIPEDRVGPCLVPLPRLAQQPGGHPCPLLRPRPQGPSTSAQCHRGAGRRQGSGGALDADGLAHHGHELRGAPPDPASRDVGTTGAPDRSTGTGTYRYATGTAALRGRTGDARGLDRGILTTAPPPRYASSADAPSGWGWSCGVVEIVSTVAWGGGRVKVGRGGGGKLTISISTLVQKWRGRDACPILGLP